LTAIRGIGPAFQQKLYDAGIGTYAQLAALSNADLEAIIQPKDWQEYNYGSWSEQAGEWAQKTGTVDTGWDGTFPGDLSVTAAVTPRDAEVPAPAPTIAAAAAGIPAQDLAAIRGIGPVFEQKLYNAGIGTYAQLAALSDAELRAIVQPADWQEFNYQSWNEQARKWAEKTGTTGATWNGIIPDDLSDIRGIGEVFEQRLYEAGILTFVDLASQTVASLESIIQPKNWQRYDFASWIAQARSRAEGEDA
jgi:predicted flap endonuclease-1-like 5' DNA nuclease